MLTKFAKKKKRKKWGVTPTKEKKSAYRYSEYKKISGARKEPAVLIPPNKNKHKLQNKIKATGEKQNRKRSTGHGKPVLEIED